jgi:flagellar biosynthesis protein FlhF
MEIKTFRARSVPEALDLVRRELGPHATVLHTREQARGLWGRFLGTRQYEVAATTTTTTTTTTGDPPASESAHRRAASDTQHPDKSTATAKPRDAAGHPTAPDPPMAPGTVAANDRRDDPADNRMSLPRTWSQEGPTEAHDGLFQAYLDLVEADTDEEIARELIAHLSEEPGIEALKPLAVRARLARLLEHQIRTTGPIDPPSGTGHLVALVGPTGVGKTTTIAKLAANYRLRENRRVGLITVDTYRIAAVEQLRTYAEIIDLPMEVVATPREMRAAVDKMRHFDLVLMDTAGRSPHDDVKIRELRALLTEAQPAEVQLVLSATSSPRHLSATVERFAPLGVTAAVLTKLDEATGLGGALTIACQADLPLSYFTDGQNVPDDISVAQAQPLVASLLDSSPSLVARAS